MNMAASEKHDENIAIQHINTNDNINVSGSEVQPENVCTIVPSAGSSEILLYVDENATQGVQDLIRVALNQNLQATTTTNNELQQQLQNVGAKITLSDIADTSTIITMPINANDIASNSAGLLQAGQSLSQPGVEHQVVNVLHRGEVKPIEMNNLFRLASLTDNLVSDNIPTDIDHTMKDDNGDDDEGTSSIGDFIIANVDSENSIPGELNIGDEFYCLEAVEEALRLYEEKHNVKLYKRDVRSLQALLKRSLKLQKLEKINESLKYGQLLYCCVFGGKRKAQKMACIDESGFSRYTDCKMFIRFAISDDGMKLVVNGKEEMHNHDTIVTNEQEPEQQYITNPGNADEIRLGAGFVDLEELYKAIHKYETDNHVHLWRRDGRTVEALAKRAPGTAKKIMDTNPGLKFAELRFCCSYGGRQQAADDKKEKRASSSFKQGCEMHIRFGISEDGSQLVVKSMSEEHNHEINEETVVKEALHPDLCVYVSKLVWNDLNIPVDDVKQKLEDYVTSVMFKGQLPPPRTRRQYFPSKKQIRYFMSKAKSSLNISQESEQKLHAQAQKLQDDHQDEKLVFNFKVQHDINLDLGNDESGDGDESLLNQPNSLSTQNEQNAKLLFCHQTPHQQRMLRRYNTQVILTQVSDLHAKIPFPLFCMYVQTNVDFQLVGEFIVQTNSNAMISEGLQKIKEWNPGWTPKFVVVDFSEEQINAVESVFPGSFVLISDASREKAWDEWLSMESNGVSDFKEDVTKYLEAIANSYSEETLNTAARELEESDVWKMSDKMRNWFQLHWLAQAKRWVVGYRPDDYIMTLHTGRVLDDEMKIFKTIKLTNKSSPLQDLIQQLVEHVVPVSKKQYEILNKDSFRLQRDLYYIYCDIPNYLTNRPGKLTHHIHERLKKASSQTFIVTDIHPGICSVQGTQPDDDNLHTVSFGDNTSFPSCDCTDWQRFKLPCIHFCAVFLASPEWSWDMMSVQYRSAPVFNVDWSIGSTNSKNDIPGFLVDNTTQTTSANLIGTPSDLRITKVGDIQRIMETPQVLASQCRGLLQQLSKLQLAHHSRENLNRLKSELKELISRFSTPQNIVSSTATGLPRLVLSTKGKRNEGSQSVFDQYNVKLVTPKQVTNAADLKLRASPIRKPHNDDENNTGDVVDSLFISTDSDHQQELVSTDHQQVSSPTSILPATTLTIKAVAPNTRKRVQSPSVFLKPTEKRPRRENAIAAKNIEISAKPGLQFSADATTISTVIDGQTVNLPLDQVAAAVASSIQDSGGGETLNTTSETEKDTLCLETNEAISGDTSIK